MDSGTLSDAKLGELVKQGFEPVRVVREERRADWDRLAVKSIPVMIVLGADGKEIARFEGDPGPQELRTLLEPHAKKG